MLALFFLLASSHVCRPQPFKSIVQVGLRRDFKAEPAGFLHLK